jgi:hypothetical protein
MEKWFKRIWLLNGIIIFFAACLFLWQQIRFDILRFFASPPPGPITGEKLEKSTADSLALQEISLSFPGAVGTSQYRFIQLKARDLTRPAKISSYSSAMKAPPEMKTNRFYNNEYNALEANSTINLIFYKQDGSDYHLLLDRKGFIASADIPTKEDSSRSFCIYSIAFEDTDNDGRLTYLDRKDMYVSDISGKNLRQVTDKRLHVFQYMKSIQDDKIIFQAGINPGDERISLLDWRESLFVYDYKNDKLSAFLPDNELLQKAYLLLLGK